VAKTRAGAGGDVNCNTGVVEPPNPAIHEAAELAVDRVLAGELCADAAVTVGDAGGVVSMQSIQKTGSLVEVQSLQWSFQATLVEL
jgi:hypothetical protein